MLPDAVWRLGAGELVLRQGDLTRSDADAVVNAANSQLAGGGGVDGAIHAAAGPGLPEACQKIVKERGHLPPGQAVITPGFQLSARYIIHTVGPVWGGGGSGEAEVLASSYLNSLTLAQEYDLKHVAFPAVSCGVYGYPVDKAAAVALHALEQGLSKEMVTQVTMYLYSPEAFDIWREIAAEILDTPRG
jgi:O-acetyl-ADP-ribose deacetylase